MTDAIRELFELLAKKENTGSDYTGTVTRVEGNTAFVRFNGSDIDDTPVSLSIGASEGDTVRVRVADGRAWLVGNDTAPPNDSSGVAYDLIRTNAYIRELTTENIRGENGWINLLNGTFDYGNGALSWNGDHLTVRGAITAISGQIGPWNINSSSIYKGSSTWGASTSGAAYFGNSGISITDKFKVDANGALTATGATISGTLTAGANSVIGPWTVTATSIYKTNSSWGSSASGAAYFGNDGISITDKFKVSSAGALTCTGANISGTITSTNATITGNITATTGSIGGFHITNTSNTGTTANGGHCYGLGMYAQCSDSSYEYEIGMKGDSGSPGYLALYIGRIAKGAAWSTNTKVFSLGNNGSLTATAGKLGPWTLNASGLTNTTSGLTTNVYPGGIYLGSSGVSVNLSDTGLDVNSSAGSTHVLQNTITASNGTVTATMNYLGFALSASSNCHALRFGHGGGSSKNVGIWDPDEGTSGGWIIAHGSANHTTVLPYYSSSDIRVKTDIKETQVKALDILKRVSVVEFKKFGVYQPIGMIADWMEELDPHFTGGGGYDEDGNMVIKYIDMFYLQGYLIKAIQELADKVSRMGG